jgi:hypothetical protein
MVPSVSSETATGPGFGRARLVSLALLLPVFSLAACGPPRERFHGTFASSEVLTETFLQALEEEDRPRLERMALSQAEFRLEFFPEMPVYGNIPPDFAWGQLEGRNRHGLATVLARQGGRPWELEEIVFAGETAYQTFTVHREPMLRLRDRVTGERREMALFGSLLEHDGRYKLVSLNIGR